MTVQRLIANAHICSFFIVNDGSPIDIGLSHGSDGAAQGTGVIDARFGGMVSHDTCPFLTLPWFLWLLAVIPSQADTVILEIHQ